MIRSLRYPMCVSYDSQHGLFVPFYLGQLLVLHSLAVLPLHTIFVHLHIIVLIFGKLNDLLIDYLSIFYIGCFFMFIMRHGMSLIYFITAK